MQIGIDSFGSTIQNADTGARLTTAERIQNLLSEIERADQVGINNMGDLLMDQSKAQAGIEFVTNGVQSAKLKPTVGKIFALEEAAEAHRYLDSNQQFGKVVLSVR